MTRDTELQFEGITQPISEWALDYGNHAEVIIGRLKRGWSVEAAITTPMRVPDGYQLPIHSNLADLAKQHGVSVALVQLRMRRGMTLSQALTAPLAHKETHTGVLSDFQQHVEGPAGVARAISSRNRKIA